MANARWIALGNRSERFVMVCNVCEGMDDSRPAVILDLEGGTYLNVSELLSWLPLNLRNRVLYSS